MSNYAASRVSPLDVLRGLIIIPMAPDPIRDFFAATPFVPKDISQTTTAWFITHLGHAHLCAG